MMNDTDCDFKLE